MPFLTMKHLVFLLCSVWLLGAGLRAQDVEIPDGVFTAGTTTLDARGRPWAYLRVIAPDPATLKGRELAVYLKPAAADAAGAFTLQGTLQPATNKALAAAYLDRAVQLGGDRAEIEAGFRALYRQAKFPGYLASLREPRQPGDPPWPSDPPQPGEPVSAEQIAMVVARGDTDVEMAETLTLASVGSPAFALATGHAWAGLLPVAAGQPVTLELRLREGGADGGVVGRIALVAGEPLPLPPPGAPVQVPDAKPTGDLNIHLRWATPPELRRYALLSSGCNLYRVDKLLADSGAITGTEELLELLDTEPGKVRRLNRGTLLPPELFTDEEVDPVAEPDRETVFFTDDNGRLERDAAGNVIGVPFDDCAEFAYYVTASDLLGRDGMLSPPGAGRVQRRMAPQVPTGLTARADILPAAAGQAERHHVTVRWMPSASTGTEVTRYEILRGSGGASPDEGPHFDASKKLNFGANLEKDDPRRFIACGVVAADAPRDPEDGTLAWIDEAPVNAPASGRPAGETVWYAVRAVYESACSVVHSAPGPPAFVAFRPVKGPPAPSPQLCAQGYNPPLAVVVWEDQVAVPLEHPVTEYRLHLACRRANAGVRMAEFYYTLPGSFSRGPFTAHFPEETGGENNGVSVEIAIDSSFFPIVVNPPTPINVQVMCRVTTDAGSSSSATATASLAASAGAGETIRRQASGVIFLGAAASLGSLPPPGPLRSAMLGNSVTSPQLRPAGGGYTLAQFPNLDELGVPEGSPLFLQARVGGGPLVDVGGALFIDGQVLVPPIDGAPATACAAWTLRTPPPPSAACSHVRGHADGSIAPVRLGLCAPAEAAEYRFYRQVDDGEPSLVAEGMVPAGGGQVFCEDGALPAASARLQYFGQFLDSFGNASPLVPLGDCPVTLAAPPPTPSLQEPEPVVDADGKAAMSLDWFCAPPGVERFEVFLGRKGAALNNGQPIGLPALAAGAITTPRAERTSALSPGSVNSGVFLLRRSNAPGPLTASPPANAFYTGRVGGDLGEGPQFHVVTPVERNITYTVWIRAIGLTGGASAPSKSWDFIWRTPKAPPAPGAEPAVDWPARPLPEAYTGSSFSPAITVNQQTFWNYDFYPNTPAPTFIWPKAPPPQILPGDPAPVTLYQRGVRIAVIGVDLNSFPPSNPWSSSHFHGNSDWGYTVNPRRYDPAAPGIRPSVTVQPLLQNDGVLRGRSDPNQHLARKHGASGETILPAVLYRRQVPSPDFPDVTGDVIQVSPLVRRIAVSRTSSGSFLVRDPFIGIEMEGQRTVRWMKQPHPPVAYEVDPDFSNYQKQSQFLCLEMGEFHFAATPQFISAGHAARDRRRALRILRGPLR